MRMPQLKPYWIMILQQNLLFLICWTILTWNLLFESAMNFKSRA